MQYRIVAWMLLLLGLISCARAQDDAHGYWFDPGRTAVNPYARPDRNGAYPNVHQCTWYAWGKAGLSGWSLDMSYAGDGRTFYDNIRNTGGRGTDPVEGSLMVLDGWGDAYDSRGRLVRKANSHGHVAYVTAVSSPTQWTVVHYNWVALSWHQDTFYRQSNGLVSTSPSGTGYPLMGFVYRPGGASSRPILAGNANPQSIINMDGRMTVLVRDVSGAIWQISQSDINGGWKEWEKLDGNVAGDPMAGRNADGRLEFFVRGNDGQIYNKWQTSPGGSWSNWGTFGGLLASNPTVSSNQDGRLQFYVRGTDNRLYTRWQQTQNGNWSDWQDFGGSASGDPFAITHSDGRQELFTLWSDQTVRSRWQIELNGGWSDWGTFGGLLGGKPVVGNHADGGSQLFVRGTDGQIYTRRYIGPNGAWSVWTPVANNITMASDPCVVYSPRTQQLHLFAIGTDRVVYTIALPGSTTWQSLGGILSNSPTASVNQDGRPQVFARGTDGVMYQKWMTPSGNWSDWAELKH